METHAPPSSSVKSGRVVRNNARLGVLMEAVDCRLRYRLGVGEYTRSPDCIFRMQIICNTDDKVLRDGTRLQPGDRIVDLHFWNQQVPPIPEAGPTLVWARRMNDGLKRSLQELAHHLATRTDVDDVVAIRIVAALGADARRDKISHILSHLGFEIVLQQETPSLTRQIRRYGENILISLLVLAYNAVARRPDTLKRGRVPAYLSRQALDARYGAPTKRARRPADLQQPEFYAGVVQVRIA